MKGSYRIYILLSECITDSDCNNQHKGACNTGTNTCQCDSGFILDGSSCDGDVHGLVPDRITLLISHEHFT